MQKNEKKKNLCFSSIILTWLFNQFKQAVMNKHKYQQY